MKLLAKLLATGVIFLGFVVDCAIAEIRVVDDAGNIVQLEKPAQKIVSLAPHVTEMLFTIGAGEKVVGAVAYSDFPAAAKKIPRVGDSANLDLEALLALKPDLVVGWRSGNPSQFIAALEKLGLNLYLTESEGLRGIADNLRELGQLTGHSGQAEQEAQRFLAALDKLTEAYSGKKPVQVFYQIWQTPLMTINGKHLISEVVELCGGENVFADLSSLAPQVDLESVVSKNVEAILISAQTVSDTSTFEPWQSWRNLQAVSNQQIYNIPWDLISRRSVRVAEGAEIICGAIDKARQTLD